MLGRSLHASWAKRVFALPHALLHHAVQKAPEATHALQDKGVVLPEATRAMASYAALRYGRWVAAACRDPTPSWIQEIPEVPEIPKIPEIPEETFAQIYNICSIFYLAPLFSSSFSFCIVAYIVIYWSPFCGLTRGMRHF